MFQPENPAASGDPLVEVAISVAFGPIKGLNQAHLGVFWKELRETYPFVHSAQPLMQPYEEFGKKGSWLPPSIQLQLTHEPALRLQMTSENDEWMCQTQLDRIVVNWRRRGGEYPRFHETWARFSESWVAWLNFLDSMSIQRPSPVGWELAYVNRVFNDERPAGPQDWPSMFPGLWGSRIAAIDGCELVGLRGQWVWDCTESAARLYIEAKPGKFGNPLREALLLTLTARGPIDDFDADSQGSADSSIAVIKRGVDSGHALVLGAFDRITENDTAKR